MEDKQLLSYSGMTKFNNCRRAFYWRYIQRREPLYTSDALSFGKLIHSCLEALYNGKEYDQLIIDNYKDLTKGRNAHYRALAFAMMAGYKARYSEQDKDVKILDTEFAFECDIINPITGRKSRKYRLRGFIDRVDERAQKWVWLHEYKTTAQLNDGYINRIRHNLQELIYVIAYEQVTGQKVRGITHDAIQKVTLTQGKGETEAEYQTRLAALIAKSKSGKSSAKRKVPESTEEFQARLEHRYLSDTSLFHREEIFIDRRRIEEAKQEIWDVTQDIGKCKSYYKNRGQCQGFGECEFFKICNSSDNPLVIQNYYKERQDEFTERKEAEGNGSF